MSCYYHIFCMSHAKYFDVLCASIDNTFYTTKMHALD